MSNLSYVSALIAMVAMVVIVLGFNGFTGAQTLEFRPIVSVCTEDDPDQDDFKLGTVYIKEQGQVLQHPDKCFGDTLVQYFCKNTLNFEGVGRHCERGCVDGVC